MFGVQVTDVTSADLRCYDSTEPGTAGTITVAAGSTIGFDADGNPPNMYHPSVVNVYMAQAPSGTDVADWDGDGTVWFKVRRRASPCETCIGLCVDLS